MVVLSKIYTRTGDDGSTHLSDMSRAPKTDARVAAYGDVDEANSVVGMALACADLPASIGEVLTVVQNELFDLGADLSTPLVAEPEFPPLRIEQSSIDRLEGWCDEFSADLPTLRSFILPGGSPASATLHLARAVSRRAERSAWAAVAAYGTGTAPKTSDAAGAPGGINELAVTYLNRLSDLLFVLARAALPTDDEGRRAEVLWVPGTDRPAPTVPRGQRAGQSEADGSPSDAGTPESASSSSSASSLAPSTEDESSSSSKSE